MKLKIDKIQLCCTGECWEACKYHSILLRQRAQPGCSGSGWAVFTHPQVGGGTGHPL